MSDNPIETGAGGTVVGTVHRKKAKSKKSKPNGATAGGEKAADPNYRTISITLPKDVLEWYEKQAAMAPSVQEYIAWQLRQSVMERQARRTLEEISRHI